MSQRFVVAVTSADGSVKKHAMWGWLRQHAEILPPGTLEARLNSRRLRDLLLRNGWKQTETEDEVALAPPAKLEVKDPVNTVSEVAALSTSTDEERIAFEFDFEASLRDFVANNLGSIAISSHRLRLYVDPTGEEGIEYSTDVGRIDVLAVDELENFYVIELKLVRGADVVMGQLTRYMGWVSATLAKGRDVHGVIVAKSIDNKLRYAAVAVPNVLLLEYEVNFQVRPVSIYK